MKYASIVLFATLLVACNRKTTAVSPVDIRIPADELVEILKDHLPESAVSRVKSELINDDQFDLELTTEQFKHLQHGFTNKVEDYARRTCSYDRFEKRATTFKEGFSSFSLSLGKGKDYHYIITGAFVLVEDRGKAVIWIKPTQG